MKQIKKPKLGAKSEQALAMREAKASPKAILAAAEKAAASKKPTKTTAAAKLEAQAAARPAPKPVAKAPAKPAPKPVAKPATVSDKETRRIDRIRQANVKVAKLQAEQGHAIVPLTVDELPPEEVIEVQNLDAQIQALAKQVVGDSRVTTDAVALPMHVTAAEVVQTLQDTPSASHIPASALLSMLTAPHGPPAPPEPTLLETLAAAPLPPKRPVQHRNGPPATVTATLGRKPVIPDSNPTVLRMVERMEEARGDLTALLEIRVGKRTQTYRRLAGKYHDFLVTEAGGTPVPEDD